MQPVDKALAGEGRR